MEKEITEKNRKLMSTISIGNETWNNLNKLRFSSRETFEEVIKRLIYENEKNIKHKE